jgi:hypothetical protein
MTNYLYEKLYMKKVVRLTESDLEKVVRKIVEARLNEFRIAGGQNKFYVLTPDDENYKKWVEERLAGRTQKDKSVDADAYFADWVNQGNRATAMKEMYSRMDQTSAKVFDSMPESFKAYCVSFYMSKIDELRKQFIVADNPTTIKQGATPGKVEEPGYSFSSANAQMGDQFAFNEAVLSNSFKSYINDVVAQAKLAIENTPNTRGVGELMSMTINASSSQIPNGVSKVTFPGKKPTFCELTEARAEAVKNYVIKAFESINVKPSSTFKLNVNTKGGNGDCTSGPKWDGTEAGKEPLKKFQRADIGFDYAIRTDSTKTSLPEDDITEVQTYMVTMGGRTRRKLKLEIRWPNIELKVGGGGGFTKKPQLCDMYKG